MVSFAEHDLELQWYTNLRCRKTKFTGMYVLGVTVQYVFSAVEKTYSKNFILIISKEAR